MSDYSITKLPNGTFRVTGAAPDGTSVNVVVIPCDVYPTGARTAANFGVLAVVLGLDKLRDETRARSFLNGLKPDDFNALGLSRLSVPVSSLTGGYPRLPCMLIAYRRRCGVVELGSYCSLPDDEWNRDGGFAFAASQAVISAWR
jgi:hypothetical protein